MSTVDEIKEVHKEVEELTDPFKHLRPKDLTQEELEEKVLGHIETLAGRERAAPAHLPDVVLRKERSWDKEKLGWSEEDRRDILQRLNRVLGLGNNESLNALHCLVGSGVSAEEAKAKITVGNFQEMMNAEDAEPAEYDRIMSDFGPEARAKSKLFKNVF